jgi:hypothetical protein
MADEDWVVLAQHVQEIAFNPIDGPAIDMLALEGALGDEGIESSFLPYRPGEGGGFTDAIRQPVQLLVKRGDLARAREVAVEILGADSELLG